MILFKFTYGEKSTLITIALVVSFLAAYMLYLHTQPEADKNLDNYFYYYDEDDDNHLSRAEFEKLCHELNLDDLKTFQEKSNASFASYRDFWHLFHEAGGYKKFAKYWKLDQTNTD